MWIIYQEGISCKSETRDDMRKSVRVRGYYENIDETKVQNSGKTFYFQKSGKYWGGDLQNQWSSADTSSLQGIYDG